VAFLYWDLIWGDGGGLVSMERNGPRLRDQYYSLRHYARYTDPGDVRVGSKSDKPEVRASAFLSPKGDRLTVIVLNTGKLAIEVRVDSGDFAVTSSAAFRTVYLSVAGESTGPLGLRPLPRPGHPSANYPQAASYRCPRARSPQ